MVVGFSFSLLKFRTEIVRSDWTSVETQWRTGSVLEAAGGKLRVAQGTFRRDWAVEYDGMRSPRSAPGKSAPVVQNWHKIGIARPSPQPPRAAPPSSSPGRFQRWKLAYKCTLMVSGVPGTGQRHRTGASSGADFGFWRPSAREEIRRLGRFRGRGRFMGAKSTQRTILVVCIHPRASPAIGQICIFYACRSMSRASRKRT